MGTISPVSLRLGLFVSVIGAVTLLLLACGIPGDNGRSAFSGQDRCPSNSESFRQMNAATYALVLVYQMGPEPGDVGFDAFGTAFAVGDRLLVTNAHVIEGIRGPTPFPVREVMAVQSGTGEVYKVLRALTHPDYNLDPLGSPDIGLLTTDKVLPTKLTLANEAQVRGLDLGDELLLAGFPGDVGEFIPVVPGVTVPQATSLSGRISALRTHRLDQVVTPENVDVVQHQAPTTPGTSGSALVHCGRVVAVNNAGTVKLLYTRGPDGEPTLTRQAAAANNFGAHIKYVEEMLSLFRDQAVQGFQIPPPFTPVEGIAARGTAGEEAGAPPQEGVPPPQGAPQAPASPECAQLGATPNFSGTLTNLTASSQASVSLTVNQSGCFVTGNLNVSPPLRGSGPFQGQIQGERIAFTVPAMTNNAGVAIHFEGTISGRSISGQYVVEAPQQRGTWQVAAASGAVPGAPQPVSPVPPPGGGAPVPMPPASPGITIDWNQFERHFLVGDVQMTTQRVSSPLGTIQEFPVVAFVVESRGTGLLVAGFQARFYDQAGIEVANFSPLTFEPDYSTIGGWHPGLRSRAYFFLPPQETLQNVRLIRISPLF